MVLSQVTVCQASEAVAQNALRQAAQGWMQVGIEQYDRFLFEAAEQSFRRARIFQKHLTAAEREKLDELLVKACASEREREKLLASAQTAPVSVEQCQPTKAYVEKVRHSESTAREDKKPVRIVPERISSPPSVQKEQKVAATESDMAKNRVKVICPRPAGSVTIKDLVDRLAPYSRWLSHRRWELLAIAIIALAPLLLIATRQRRRMASKGVYKSSPTELANCRH
jgi:hypothetical protein